jgi:hypothetical protein
VALSLRLGKRIRVGDEVEGEVLGLAGYECQKCVPGSKVRKCPLDGRQGEGRRVVIDYHFPTRPEDVITFCPGLAAAECKSLTGDVYHMAEVEARGGPGVYYGQAPGLLPEALMGFYGEVEGALDRFRAEAQAARGRK